MVHCIFIAITSCTNSTTFEREIFSVLLRYIHLAALVTFYIIISYLKHTHTKKTLNDIIKYNVLLYISDSQPWDLLSGVLYIRTEALLK